MQGIEIKRRYEALKNQRRTIENTWADVETYVCPQRGEFFADMNSEHEQRWHRTEHYDSTAIFAAKTLASHIHGMLTSPATKWFGLEFRNDALNESQEASEWLEKVEEIVYQELQQSNFNVKSAEFFLDLVTYGLAFISEEVENDKDFETVDFRSIGVREAYFEIDHKDRMVAFYRRLQWTPVQILEKFGDDTPAEIREKAESAGAIDSKEEVIFCIFKRPGKENNVTDTTPENRPFGSKYILCKTGEQLGDEGGYYEMPAFYSLWESASQSKYGYSPAMQCIADIKNVNYFMQLKRESVAKAVAPPVLAEDRALLTDLDMAAHGLTVVRRLDQVREFVTGARFDVAFEELQDFRRTIERSFLMDSLQLKDSPAMTATEVQARYDLMMRNISQTLGRLQSNFLDPIVTRTARLLMRAGKLPPAPQQITGDIEYDIVYTGPMPRAQGRDQVMATTGWLGTATSLAEFNPSVLDLPDWDMVVRDMAIKTGVPAKYVRSSDEVEAIRKQRQAEQDRQRKLAEAQAAGKAMQDMATGAEMMEQSPSGVNAMRAV